MQFEEAMPPNQHLQRVEETPAKPADHVEETLPRPGTVTPLNIITSTPVLRKVVVSPKNLGVDSDTVTWSFSMGTPAMWQTVKESPVSPSTSTTTTTSHATTDESVLELRNMLNEEGTRGSRKGSCRERWSSRKFHLLDKGDRSVARALFPARSSSGSTLSMSPLVHHHQAHTANAAGKSSGLTCSQELFETSSDYAAGITSDSESEVDKDSVESAETIKVIPASPVEQSLPCKSEEMRDTIEQTPLGKVEGSSIEETPTIPLDTCPWALKAVRNEDLPEQTPKIPHQKKFSLPAGVSGDGECLMETPPVHPCKFLLDEAGNKREFIEQTPVIPQDTAYQSACTSTLLSDQTKLTPDVPSTQATEPTSPEHQKTSGAALTCLPLSPAGGAKTTPCSSSAVPTTTGLTFSDGEDVLDILFMSSSQLESHMNLHSTPLGTGEIENSLPMKRSNNGESEDDRLQEKKKPFSYPSLRKRKSKRLRIRTRPAVSPAAVGSSGAVREVCAPETKRLCMMADKVEEAEESVADIQSDSTGCKTSDDCSTGDDEVDSVKEELLVAMDDSKSQDVDDTSMDCSRDDATGKGGQTDLKQSLLVNLPPVNESQSGDSTATHSVVKLSSPILFKRSLSAPGLSRRRIPAKKQVSRVASGDFTGPVSPPVAPTTEHKHSEPSTAVASNQEEDNTEVTKELSFGGFKTAAGSCMSVSAATLDRAKQLISEVAQTPTSAQPLIATDITCTSVPATTSSNALPSVSSSSLPRSTSSTPQTYPSFVPANLHKKAPPKKPFKAPRRACDVSKEEERASVARVLRRFGVPRANSGVVISVGGPDKEMMDSGFATASGKKLSVSHSAMLQAQKILEDDKENVIDVNGSKCEVGFLFDETEFSLPRRAHQTEPLSPIASFMASTPKKAENLSSAGFKTAGGKDISVSMEAFKKAEDFCSLSDEVPSLKGERGPDKSVKEFVTGFKTAGGKGISVSMEAFKEAEDICSLSDEVPSLKGECGPDKSAKEFVTGFKTAGGKGISVSMEAFRKAEDICSLRDKEQAQSFNEESGADRCVASFVTGFKTADGKGISVSMEAFKKAEDICSLRDEGQSLKGECGPDMSAKEFVTGFKTAGGKGISISMEAFGKAEGICSLRDEEQTQGESDPDASAKEFSFVTGFKTAGGSVCTVSRKSLDVAKRDFDSKPEDEAKENMDVSTFGGEDEDSNSYFSTQVVRQVFDEESNSMDTDKTPQSEHPSPVSISAARTDTSQVTSPPSPAPMDITEAASYKHVSPLSDSVSTDSGLPAANVAGLSGTDSPQCKDAGASDFLLTESMIENMDMSCLRDTDLKQEQPVDSTSVLQSSDTSQESDYSCVESHHNNSSSQGVGEERVSENSPTTQRSPFVSNPSSHMDQNASLAESALTVPFFMTAGGKEVKVSSEALEAVRTKFAASSEYPTSQVSDRNDEEAVQFQASHQFPGLQTASGKKVDVKAESIRAVKMVLDESPPPSGAKFPGLQTASGKKVDVKAESIRAVKMVLDESPPPSGAKFPGLQTAGGKKVDVKAESIRAVKMVLDEPSGAKFPGLQTASGKKVDIKAESIRAVKRTLDKTPVVSTGVNDVAALKDLSNATAHQQSFPGLQTASGKEVTICADSIRAAKRTLGSDTIATGEAALIPVNPDRYPRLRSSTVAAAPSRVIARHEQESQKLNRSLTSIPERTLCDRNKGCLQPLFSSSLEAATTTSTYHGPHCHTQQGPHIFGYSQQNPTFAPAIFPRTTPVRNSKGQSSSHHNPTFTPAIFPRTTPVRNSKGQSSSHYNPTFAPAIFPRTTPIRNSKGQSSSHSINLQHASPVTGYSVCSSYTAASRSDFCQDPSKNSRLPIWSGSCGKGDRNVALPSARSSGHHYTASQRHTKGGSCVRSEVVSPLSPLQITLSQVCDMEDSLVEFDDVEPTRKTASSQGKGGVTEDSGYISRDVSALKSPSPFHPDQNALPTVSEDDMLFADFAMEDLEDTLEMEDTENQYVASSPEQAMSDLHRKSEETSSVAPSDGLEGASSSKAEVYSMTPVEGKEDSTIIEDLEDWAEDGKTEDIGMDTASVAEDTSSDKTEDIGMDTASVAEDTSSSETEDIGKKLANMTEDIGKDYANVMKSASIDETKDIGMESANLTENTSSDKTENIREDPANGAASLSDEIGMDSANIKEDTTSSNRNVSVVKPQLGSLLEIRLQHKSGRIPLKALVNAPPRRWDHSELCALGVSECVQAVTSQNAEDFRFSEEFFSSDGEKRCKVGDGATVSLDNMSAGVGELWEAFRSSPGVDAKLISHKWFANHFKSVVVKLAAMEVTYPQVFAGRCLTPDRLILQMKYRYDREIDRAQRSAIHKICEHDDSPSRRMVLYVSKCYSCADKSLVASASDSTTRSVLLAPPSPSLGNSFLEETNNNAAPPPPAPPPPCIELSDGWYGLPCILDQPLRHMLRTGRIRVGMKLITSGAELLGLSSPSHPLEVPPSCCLRISANSTRRAKWFARLGYQPSPRPLPVPLESLFGDGGKVGCTRAVIARVYPLTYLERSGETKKMRCERLEKKEEVCYRRAREQAIEDISAHVQREFENEISQQEFGVASSRRRRRSRRLNTAQIKQLQNGEEIYQAIATAPDPQSIQECLSPTQLAYLESYKLSLIAQRQSELRDRIQAAIREKQIPERNVVPLLKMRLVPTGGRCSDLDCQLSFWQPDANVLQLKEGTCVELFNLIASQSRNKFDTLQLTACRLTTLECIDISSDATPYYCPRTCTKISSLSTSQTFHKEFDTVGVTVHLHTSHVTSHDPDSSDRVVDTIYLSDSDEGILLVKAWGGVKAYGLEDMVVVGTLLALSNLSLRSTSSSSSRGEHSHRSSWPVANLGDHTVVSQNPGGRHLRTALAKLKQELPVPLSDHIRNLAHRITEY